MKYAYCLMDVDPIFRLSVGFDVNVPFQVVGYGHSKVFYRRYSGQCVAV